MEFSRHGLQNFLSGHATEELLVQLNLLLPLTCNLLCDLEKLIRIGFVMRTWELALVEVRELVNSLDTDV